MDAAEVAALDASLTTRTPQEILAAAHVHAGREAAISFSGAEDVALIAMAHEEGLDFRVFCLDTGRLHGETYRLLEAVRERYGVTIEIYSPQAEAVEALTSPKGLFSFYRDGHSECCGIRKVAPLRRALQGRPAWITGQRRDQSRDTRADLPVVQLDAVFGTPESPLLKWNPLANWTSQKVWSFIRAADVPYNALHERGFVSIGCEPCTRAVLPGQPEREGRWWWEQAEHKECGIHLGSGLDPSKEIR